MIFDSHAHYTDAQFQNDFDTLYRQMQQNGVARILTCATDFKDCEAVLRLCEQYENLYAAVGVYPHETHLQGEWDESRLRRYAAHEKAVAIGEIGLDYHYDGAPKSIQKEWVVRQIELANELAMPISFHDREAHGDTLEILKTYRPKGVVHCFSGSVEMAREVIKIGMFIGIGGAVTFKNARVPVEVVEAVPIEHILLETDAPYMTPAPHRGKRNRSDYILLIAQKIAEIKGMTAQAVIDATEQNANRLFGL